MRPLNYRHLHYFWAVAKAGGVVRASELLHLTPQSISGQLRILEESLNERLMRRKGRSLELTDAGRLVFDYADEIFALGAELRDALQQSPPGRVPLFRVGVGDIVSKAVACHLLEPALRLPDPVRLVCREWRLRGLLAELAVHRLELVLADRPMPQELGVKAFSHFLGECGVTFVATPDLKRAHRGPFPRCLDGAPLLLPGEDAAVRQRLLQWLDKQRIHPRIVAEFDDPALLNTFGQAGAGVFPVPSIVARSVSRERSVVSLGTTDVVTEQYYAISMERRFTHPAVVAIGEVARRGLFGESAARLRRRRGSASR